MTILIDHDRLQSWQYLACLPSNNSPLICSCDRILRVVQISQGTLVPRFRASQHKDPNKREARPLFLAGSATLVSLPDIDAMPCVLCLQVPFRSCCDALFAGVFIRSASGPAHSCKFVECWLPEETNSNVVLQTGA